MEKDRIIKIVAIVVVAVIAIVVIVLLNNGKKNVADVSYYTATVSNEFEEKLINDFKEFKKFTKEYSIELARKNHQNYTALEIFNEDYFQTNKLAALSIYEDNASNYVYEIDSIDYNEDKTSATINYTLDISGYNGSLTSSWVNCFMIELEGTVTSVNFVKSELN